MRISPFKYFLFSSGKENSFSADELTGMSMVPRVCSFPSVQTEIFSLLMGFDGERLIVFDLISYLMILTIKIEDDDKFFI